MATSFAGAQASIGNNQTMNSRAAQYFNALKARILKESGIVIVATEGTRSWERQNHLYQGYIQGLIDPTTGKRYNAAWSPNKPSIHQVGNAVDVGSGVGFVNTAAAKIFRKYAAAYGFHETIAGEPWHFEFSNPTIDLSNTPEKVEEVPAEETDDDMKPFLIQRTSDGQLALVGLPGSGYVVVRNPAHYLELINVFNNSGVKLQIKQGLVDFPAFSQLGKGTHFQSFSDNGYGEALAAFTPNK